MAKTAFLEPGRLSRRNLWGYSMGGIGRDMVYQLINTYLLTFILFTKSVTTAEFATLSAIMIGCRIFDGLNDPLMGAIVERTRSKIGKFKPWILIGMATNIAVIMALFWVPLKGTDYVIFFAFGYLLWGITYTMNDISYWGMMPSLTSHEGDRNNLSTLANLGAGIGAALAMLAIPTLTGGGSLQLGGNAITAYGIISAIVCAIFAGCQIMTCLVVKERPLPVKGSIEDTEKTTIKGMFKVIFKNDQLLVTAGSMLMYNVGSAIMIGLSTYFIYFRYGYVGTLVTVFTVLSGATSALMVFYPLLAKKFTRKQIAQIAGICICIGYSLLLIVGLAWNGPFTPGTANYWGSFVVLALCGTFASAGHVFFYMILTLSISNSVEYNELKTGKRQEGIIFAIRPLMAKLGSALQLGIITIVLVALGVNGTTQLISDTENKAQNGQLKEEFSAAFELNPDEFIDKYVEEADKATDSALSTNEFVEKYIDEYKADEISGYIAEVDPSVTMWMIACMAIIPAILLSAGILFWLKKYKITEIKYKEICDEIEARKALIAAGAVDVEIIDDQLILEKDGEPILEPISLDDEPAIAVDEVESDIAPASFASEEADEKDDVDTDK